MEAVAAYEGIDVKDLMAEVAAGTIVIPAKMCIRDRYIEWTAIILRKLELRKSFGRALQIQRR